MISNLESQIPVAIRYTVNRNPQCDFQGAETCTGTL